MSSQKNVKEKCQTKYNNANVARYFFSELFGMTVAQCIFSLDIGNLQYFKIHISGS